VCACVCVCVRVCACVCVCKTEGDNGVARRILSICDRILLYCVQIVVNSLTKLIKGNKDW